MSEAENIFMQASCSSDFTMWKWKIPANINSIPGVPEIWGTSDHGSKSYQQRRSQVLALGHASRQTGQVPFPITMGPPSSSKSKLLYRTISQVHWTPLEQAVFWDKTEFSVSHLTVLIRKEIYPFQLKIRAAHGLFRAFSQDDHIELISSIKAPNAWAAICFHIFSSLVTKRNGDKHPLCMRCTLKKRIYLELIETCLHTNVKRCLENRTLYYEHFSFYLQPIIVCFLNTSFKPYVSPHQLIYCFQLLSAPVFTQTGKNTERSS